MVDAASAKPKLAINRPDQGREFHAAKSGSGNRSVPTASPMTPLTKAIVPVNRPEYKPQKVGNSAAAETMSAIRNR